VRRPLKVKRQTRVMPGYQFILAMVLACYVGFSRLPSPAVVQREPIADRILGVLPGYPRNVLSWRLGFCFPATGRPVAGNC